MAREDESFLPVADAAMAPSRANSLASEAPGPRARPLIRATFPSNLPILLLTDNLCEGPLNARVLVTHYLFKLADGVDVRFWRFQTGPHGIHRNMGGPQILPGPGPIYPEFRIAVD